MRDTGNCSRYLCCHTNCLRPSNSGNDHCVPDRTIKCQNAPSERSACQSYRSATYSDITSHELVISCRMTNACQNTEPHNRCQETSFHIFFRRVINDANPASARCGQFLHFIRIGWADPWLVLCAFLRPANKRTFQAQSQDLRS